MSPVASRLRDFLLARGLLGQPLALALSGGGDSVALLRLLQEAGIESPTLLHFNHRWGPHGDEAEALVRKLAEQFGLLLKVGYADAPAPTTNKEAHARALRYAFFKEAGQGLPVLVAHTQTDVAENLLLRLAKGSGVQGLTALSDDTDVLGVRVLRPLLEVEREALRGYLHALGQDFFNDPTNPASGRGALREAEPLLNKLGLTSQNLAASARALAAAQAVVAQSVADALTLARFDPRFAVVPLGVVLNAPEETALQVLAQCMTHLTGEGLAPRRSKRLALLLRLQQEETGKATLGGCIFEWFNGRLHVTLEHPAA